MNIVTTSRKPSRNTRRFARRIAPLLDAVYLTRGKASLSALNEMAFYEGINKIVLVAERKANPFSFFIYSVSKNSFELSSIFHIEYYALSNKRFPNDIAYNIKEKNNLDFFKLLGVDISYKDSDYILKDDKSFMELSKGNNWYFRLKVKKC